MLRNPHFWINITITAFIGYVYYDWYNRFDWFWWFSIQESYRHIVGGLFLIPFVYGYIVFKFRVAAIFWSLAFIITLPRIVLFSYLHVQYLVYNILVALIPLVLAGTLTLELNWREKQKILQEHREEERKIYVSQIFQAQEKERQRIAFELHDSCMQQLVAAASSTNNLASLNISKDPERVKEQVYRIRDTILHVSEELRRISLDLRPGLLDDLGLVPAVRWLASHMGQESQVHVFVVVKGKTRKLPPKIEETIFRIVQEALNNVRRHSEATEVTVSIEFKPRFARVTIQDNGKGFATKAIRSTLAFKNKLGILSMEQRAKSINSTLTIKSQPGAGTMITIDADID